MREKATAEDVLQPIFRSTCDLARPLNTRYDGEVFFHVPHATFSITYTCGMWTVQIFEFLNTVNEFSNN